jgi:prolyl 4-hydroxylase
VHHTCVSLFTSYSFVAKQINRMGLDIRRVRLRTLWIMLVGVAILVLWVTKYAKASLPRKNREDAAVRLVAERARTGEQGAAISSAGADTPTFQKQDSAARGTSFATTQGSGGGQSDAQAGDAVSDSAKGAVDQSTAGTNGEVFGGVDVDAPRVKNDNVDIWGFVPAARSDTPPPPPTLVAGVDYVADYDVGQVQPPSWTSTPAAFEYVPRSSPYPHAWVSEQPRVVVAPHFITDEEADELVALALATGRVQANAKYRADHRSAVNGAFTDTFTCAMRLSPHEQPGKKYVDRILDFLGFTGPNKVPQNLQLLHYAVGASSHFHRDYDDPKALSMSNSGQHNENSAATALLYLAPTELGGETCFPMANGRRGPIDKIVANHTDCSHGLRVRPRKGTLVVFYNLRPDLSVDECSQHISCPVLKGEKWAAPLLLHSLV